MSARVVTIIRLVAAVTLLIGGSERAKPGTAMRSNRYADLVALFADWRAFQKPTLVNGVPDYTAAAMAAQQRALPGYQQRLAAIDPSGTMQVFVYTVNAPAVPANREPARRVGLSALCRTSHCVGGAHTMVA